MFGTEVVDEEFEEHVVLFTGGLKMGHKRNGVVADYVVQIVTGVRGKECISHGLVAPEIAAVFVVDFIMDIYVGKSHVDGIAKVIGSGSGGGQHGQHLNRRKTFEDDILRKRPSTIIFSSAVSTMRLFRKP